MIINPTSTIGDQVTCGRKRRLKLKYKTVVLKTSVEGTHYD